MILTTRILNSVGFTEEDKGTWGQGDKGKEGENISVIMRSEASIFSYGKKEKFLLRLLAARQKTSLVEAPRFNLWGSPLVPLSSPQMV